MYPCHRLYIYIYIYVHIYIYIYVCIHLHLCVIDLFSAVGYVYTETYRCTFYVCIYIYTYADCGTSTLTDRILDGGTVCLGLGTRRNLAARSNMTPRQAWIFQAS